LSWTSSGFAQETIKIKKYATVLAKEDEPWLHRPGNWQNELYPIAVRALLPYPSANRMAGNSSHKMKRNQIHQMIELSNLVSNS
jgi:predicted RNase H-like nuclease